MLGSYGLGTSGFVRACVRNCSMRRVICEILWEHASICKNQTCQQWSGAYVVLIGIFRSFLLTGQHLRYPITAQNAVSGHKE